MAIYTLELNQIIKSKIDIFTEDYPFYNDEYRKIFEDKFIRHFYFREIGVETIDRFLFNLNTKLIEIMPKYEHLYRTTTFIYDPILNYDVKESITREVVGENSSTLNSSNNGVNKAFDTPITKNNNYKNSPSFISENDDNVNTSGKGTNKSNEVNTRRTSGNIGVMTTQDLIMKERQIIINIDMMILEECEDLFMQVY